MKKYIYTSFIVLATILIFGFLAWAFSLHGTIGLFHVNRLIRILFICIAVIGLVLPGLVLLKRRLKTRHQVYSTSWLTVLIVILTLFGIIGIPLGFFYLNGFPSSGIGNIPPQLLIADGSGVDGIPDLAVTFYTDTLTNNTLTWGKSDTSFTLHEEIADRQHIFLLRNLEPSTEYWYRINDGSTYYFITPPADGHYLRFAACSDAHFGSSTSCNDLTVKMLNHIAEPANGFYLFFSLGDLVEYGFRDSHWKEAFQTISPTTSTIPTRFVVGNHETLFTGLKRYEDYCYPEDMELQTGSRLWNRIDIGNIHFLTIDLEWSAESFSKLQATWLEEQLRSIPDNEWKIVMGHGFYFASGSVINGWQWYDNQETIQLLSPLFEKYKVDMVFSGHTHQLELLQKSGVTYIVCGGFGGALEPERDYESPYSLWYATGEHSFVEVIIDGEKADIIFRDPDYQALENFTISKSR
jgi:UDP-2,3-diacylglucosamine pyrophosphatase LpxH